VRDPDPARVVYVTYPRHDFPEYGLVYDGAYWVSDVVVRRAAEGGDSGRVEAQSHALAGKLHEPVEQILVPGGGTFAPTGDPYQTIGRRRAPVPREAINAFALRLRNVARVGVDLPRMGIEPGVFTFTAVGDGASELLLRGPFTADQRVHVDGSAWRAWRSGTGSSPCMRSSRPSRPRSGSQ
jgi:hypothetical protein